jgi:PAS domain S-box-containing protein
MSFLTRASLRIVHVEDRDDFSRYLQTALSKAGFTQPIVHFDCGYKALEYFWTIPATAAPHLVLLDLKIDDFGGLEIIEWLRTNYFDPEVSIFVLTASEDTLDIRSAFQSRASRYLLKTAPIDELIEALDQLIAKNNRGRLKELNDLPESLRELALMGEFSEEMVVLVDVEGRVKWVNESFIKTCGYTLNELRGQKPGDLLQGPDSEPAAVQALYDAVQSRNPCECTLINYRKDGTPYQVAISMGPVLSHGNLDGFIALERALHDPPAAASTQEAAAL